MASDDDMTPELGGAAEVFGVETPHGEEIRGETERAEAVDQEREAMADEARRELNQLPPPPPPPPVTAKEFKQGLAEDFLGEPKPAAPPAPATTPPAPSPPKGCMSRVLDPKVLAIEAVVLIAAVLLGFAAEIGPFGDDDAEEVSTRTPSGECRDEGALGGERVVLISFSQECIDPSAGASTTTTTTEEATTTTTPAIDPLAPVTLTGQFDEIDGQPIEGVFRNEVALVLGPDGLTGTMDLVVDSSFNFDTEEPVCFSFAVDLADAPIATELAEDGSREVLGPTTIVVGFTDGACTGGPPGETESRAGEVALTVPQDARSISGQLVLEGTPLVFTVAP